MKRLILPLLTMAFLGACTTSQPSADSPPSERPGADQEEAQVLLSRMITLQSESGENIKILAEIADEPQARARGLMFRESLSEGAGMLFIFDAPEPLVFWMKNTLIPLDVIFFGAGGSFISAASMVPCTADPCPTYVSALAAKYALEVEAGFSEEYGVGKGWRLLQ